MEKIPQEPVMLLSWLNLKLRDFYPNLEELCASLDLDQKALEEKMNQLDYHYDSDRNQFI